MSEWLIQRIFCQKNLLDVDKLISTLLQSYSLEGDGADGFNSTQALKSISSAFLEHLIKSTANLKYKKNKARRFSFQGRVAQKNKKIILPSYIQTGVSYLDFFLKNISKKLYSSNSRRNLLNHAKILHKDFFKTSALFEFYLDENSTVDISYNTLNGSIKKILEVKRTKNKIDNLNLENLSINLSWFEFDIKGQKNDCIPSFFIDIHPGLSKKNIINFINIIQGLSYAPLNEGIEVYLKDLIELLPENARFSQLGFMDSREKNVYKLITDNFDKNLIISYLKNLQSNINIDSIAIFLNRIKNLLTGIRLAIDIDSKGIAKISLEIKGNESSYREILNIFMAMNICIPEKAAGILSSEFLFWEPGGDYYFAIISHLKISFTASEITAKAYMTYKSSAMWLQFFPIDML